MKRIAEIREGGKLAGLVHGPDYVNQVVTVNGRKWRFDFDEWMGPLWLRADGYTERQNQNPPKAVWRAFERWCKRHSL
jgi:hypothetical protein